MNVWAAALSAMLAASSSSLALAGPAVDAAMRAEVLQAEGKTGEALSALEEAVDVIWTQSPLAFRSVRLVDAAGPTPMNRPNNAFNPGEPLVVYFEAVGYGFGQAGDQNSVDLSIGLAIENATGQVLSEAPDLFSLNRKVLGKRRDLGWTVAFKVPALYPAEYKAVFTVRDRNSDKTASFDMPFTIAVPGSEPAMAAPGSEPAPAEAAPSAENQTDAEAAAGVAAPNP